MSQTRDEIREYACETFTEDSVRLCEERLLATNRGHAFTGLIGYAMTAVRLRGRRWREDLKAAVVSEVEDQVAQVALEWAVDALKERT